MINDLISKVILNNSATIPDGFYLLFKSKAGESRDAYIIKLN